MSLAALFLATIVFARNADPRRLATAVAAFIAFDVGCYWWAQEQAEQLAKSGVFAPDAGAIDGTNIIIIGGVGAIIGAVGIFVAVLRSRRVRLKRNQRAQ